MNLHMLRARTARLPPPQASLCPSQSLWAPEEMDVKIALFLPLPWFLCLVLLWTDAHLCMERLCCVCPWGPLSSQGQQGRLQRAYMWQAEEWSFFPTVTPSPPPLATPMSLDVPRTHMNGSPMGSTAPCSRP